MAPMGNRSANAKHRQVNQAIESVMELSAIAWFDADEFARVARSAMLAIARLERHEIGAVGVALRDIQEVAQRGSVRSATARREYVRLTTALEQRGWLDLLAA